MKSNKLSILIDVYAIISINKHFYQNLKATQLTGLGEFKISPNTKHF